MQTCGPHLEEKSMIKQTWKLRNIHQKTIIWIDYPHKTFHQHDFCRASWVTVNQHIFKSSLTINFCQKQRLLVILWNEKHSSKQAVQITYTLEESFLQQLLLKVCVLFLFIKSEKTGIMLWSVWLFSAFLGKRRPNK